MPPAPPNRPPPASTVLELRQHLDRRLGSLRAGRMSYLLHWRELSDYILPRRGRFLVTPNQGNRGEPRNEKIIDSTGTLAARTLASGMMAGITSPARPWFRLTLSDPEAARDTAVRLWLDEVAKRMARVFAKSNFYNSLAVLYEELGVFGTGAMIILEDFEDVIRCQTLTVGEYFLANSDRQAVNTLYREFPLTVGQVVAQFGEAACTPTVLALYRTGQLDMEVMIGHAVEPNDDELVAVSFAEGMPYRSVYWELGSSQSLILAARGFREFPVCAPRWAVVGNDVYGRSPGMDALGDVKALQVEQKRKAQAIEKMVNPPMVADVSLKNQPATLLPGGVTYLPGNAAGVGFRPVYEVDPPLPGLVQDIAEVQARIGKAFYADLWLMMSELDGIRTATEINERKQEKLLMLGPVLERVQAEMLDPAIKRAFAVMARAGLLPPAPPPLRRQSLQVEYTSMLAQAQKSVATAGIERLMGFVATLAPSRPDVADNIDYDEVVDEYAALVGVSPRIVLPPPAVAQLRQARQQQAAAAQAQQQAVQTGTAVARGALDLSEARIGNHNLLETAAQAVAATLHSAPQAAPPPRTQP